MIVLGIDPGKDGYMVWLGDRFGQHVLNSVQTPMLSAASGGKREYYVAEMWQRLRWYIADLVVLEKQQAMPKSLHGRTQGTASSFSTGYGYGLWVGLITAMDIPLLIVHPRTWQKELHRDIPGDDPKARSIIAAGRLYPGVDLRATGRCTKPHTGKVDALLLAHYGLLHGTAKETP